MASTLNVPVGENIDKGEMDKEESGHQQKNLKFV
jgi:hypothetical protein